MLTAKHYREVARILATARVSYPFSGVNAIQEVANMFCEMAKGENPRFDRERFLKASRCVRELES